MVKYISQEDFNLLDNGYHACFYGGFSVGKEYVVAVYGSKTTDKRLLVRCTQNCPTALYQIKTKWG